MLSGNALDKYDWTGCETVRHNPEKLSGRGTVGDLRMHADGILDNYDEGLTVDEIVVSYGVPRDAVESILAFAGNRRLKATA